MVPLKRAAGTRPFKILYKNLTKWNIKILYKYIINTTEIRKNILKIYSIII
jgi:hypothetical protein